MFYTVAVEKMALFSSSSSTSKFALLSPSQIPNSSKFSFPVPLRTLPSSSSYLVSNHVYEHESASSSSSPILQEKPQKSAIQADSEMDDEDDFDEEIMNAKKSLEELLVIRRSVKVLSDEEEEEGKFAGDGGSSASAFKLQKLKTSSAIDLGLSRFAKKMPIFEPERVVSSSERPLLVNLDLALYRAKILVRNYQYEEAEEILKKCISYWPEDGRPYVALGKAFSKQSRMNEARTVYEKGCQATQGENSYIWQCWAVLENKIGNTRRARELFDAATVADKRHIAAWHGWAVLEMQQGNIKKARNLLGKGLKYCGGNEYIYQTLALLEVRAKRYEQAQYLFRKAIKCNPKSCASWLAWAQLEAQQENNPAARRLFEKAVHASPKNRFTWHVWGVFEANLGNVDLARKLLKVGHAVNPRDPVLLQSLALLEYRYSTANLARVLFRRASELDPRHQPVWIAWGWMEWKEGNLGTARELYQKSLSIDCNSESSARCLQAWGVLEQRVGNLSAARRLFRSSLNINSQSYVTWMTWASLEEDQGNSVRAEEIRNLYFQQRTEVVDDASWIMGFLDIIDPAIDSIKRLLNLKGDEYSGSVQDDKYDGGFSTDMESGSGFILDKFIRDKLLLDPLKLEVDLEPSRFAPAKGSKSWINVRGSERKDAAATPD